MWNRMLFALACVALIAALGMGSGAASSKAAPPAGAPRVDTGPLRIELTSDQFWKTDPALAYFSTAWEFEYATCATLLNYPDAPGAPGSRVQPEIAATMPSISSDRRTYTFQIRNDYAFSPPATGIVTAQSMKYTIERALDPDLAGPGGQFLVNIEGAVEYMNRQRSQITGIVAQGTTLTIHLLRPEGEILTLLSLPFFCAVPTSMPRVEQIAPIPSAGPYYISQRTIGQSLVLSRNPNYTGSRPHHFDSIEYAVGRSEQEILQRVESGLSDYALSVPAAEVQRLYEQYGPESPAASRGFQQFFVDPQDCTGYLPLNTERTLFSEVNMRKAVNFAVDRAAYGAAAGPHAATPHDQYLPPGNPSYENIDVYPDHPDIERARDLAGWHPGDPRRPITVYYRTSGSTNQEQYQVVKSNLEQIGFDVTGIGWPGGQIYTEMGRRGAPFDLGVSAGWCASYNDPWQHLQLFDGTTIQPENNINFAYFNDPIINERLHAARRLAGDERYAAFREIEHDLVLNYAPHAAMRLYNNRYFFSRRIGGQIYHIANGIDLAALAVRPLVTVGDVEVTEPVSGTVTATFTVRLSSEMDDPFAVDYATADGTAQAGADYTATSGTLTFAPTERTQTVDVTVNADNVDEASETFFLNLTNESSGTIVDGQGTATIADGTPPPPPVPPPPLPPPPPPPPPPAPPPPPPPPPTVKCRVPAVIGLRLGVARSRIRRAHCRVGPVRSRHGVRPRKVGRVVAQQPRPRTLLPQGGRVRLVVGRR